MDNDLISREALQEEHRKECIHNCYYCQHFKWSKEKACSYCDVIDNAPTVPDHSLEIAQKSIELGRSLGRTEERVESKRAYGKWIPIKTRELTEEEKEEYPDCTFMYDCKLPEDGEEVLVTTWYGDTALDTFCRDDGCYFENYCDEGDVIAWMPLPKHFAEKELGSSEDETDMMEHAMFEEEPKCLYRTEKMSYQDNWDTRTALKCQLPKIIPNACGDCRDQKFCEAGHGKQISFDDLVGGEE